MLKQIWTRVAVVLFKDPRRFDISNNQIKDPQIRLAPVGFTGPDWYWMLVDRVGCRRPLELDEAHKLCLKESGELTAKGMKPADILKALAAEKTGKTEVVPFPSNLER